MGGRAYDEKYRVRSPENTTFILRDYSLPFG